MHRYLAQKKKKKKTYQKNSNALPIVHLIDEKSGPRAAFYFLGPIQNIV